MSDFLVERAISQIWCAPDQDQQVVFKPARISVTRGAFRHVDYLWRRFNLPNTTSSFHVFQIGRIHPTHINLPTTQNQWMRLSGVCERQNLHVDLYTNEGIQLPRTRTWILLTDKFSVLFAVEEIGKINQDLIGGDVESPLLRVRDLFVRVYSNAYFRSGRWAGPNPGIVVRGGIVNTTTEITQLGALAQEQIYLRGQGGIIAFANGRRVPAINIAHVKRGDYAEFVYDASIKRVERIPIDQMHPFTSELDNKSKKLVHYEGRGDGVIDYQDDIDFYLLRPQGSGNGYRGVYYHKNQNDAVRMITHKDYSIVTSYVDGYVTDLADFNDKNDLDVQLIIRRAGFDRQLVFEHNRIHELYKLNDEDVVNAMLGVDSNVDNWRAENLEKSAYTEIMQMRAPQLTHQKAIDAFGYNAAAKAIGNTPQWLTSSGNGYIATLPVGLRDNATVFEYDQQGRLISFHHHSGNQTYIARDNKARMIEAIVGRGGKRLSAVFGSMEVQINPHYNHRFYTTPLIDGQPDPDGWVDVTDNEGIDYAIVEDVVHWLIDAQELYPMVRSDENFLLYEALADPSDGVIELDIESREIHPDGEEVKTLYVPTGQLDIWLNGYAMIEGLDFLVEWPRVVLTHKQHLNTEHPNQIVVRGMGFADKNNFSRIPEMEFGFVEHGLLSRNNQYDIRDDRVFRVIAGGKVRHPGELTFAEDNAGVSVEGLDNGTPYLIKENIVPLHTHAPQTNTYTLREKSREVDQKVSDYLSMKIPEPEIDELSSIEERYAVFSPFMARVIYEIKNGLVDSETLAQGFTDQDVQQWLAPFEGLLAFEPVFQDTVEQDYVNVHPHQHKHPVKLNVYQYSLVRDAVRIYLNDKVDLSQFINVGFD